VVVHLHAIEVLVHLVKRNYESAINSLLSDSIRCATVGYHKPGSALAKAVNHALSITPDANIVFLQNHGVVVGGVDIKEVDSTLCSLIERLSTMPQQARHMNLSDRVVIVSNNARYLPIADDTVHQLATEPTLFERLESDWALYPDHVVFLGARAALYNSVDALQAEFIHGSTRPEVIFVKGIGVFAQPGFSVAKQLQLRCYYEVLSRLRREDVVNVLSSDAISELLNWDAEKYRLNIAK
jgi:rhamnose utilization protein RhaD (predicted bifunctional aldolase and dehydrogenase)